MRASAWWRRREEPARSQAAAAGAVDTDVPPDSIGSVASFLDRDPAPDDLIDPERAAEYSAWADRLRQKRENAKRTINGDDQVEASHWSADHVYRESERVADEELSVQPDPLVLTGKLGVLGLDDSATDADIERAYRRLAKRHHPDFHHDADDETRRYHAEQMRQVNEAYRSLKRIR